MAVNMLAKQKLQFYLQRRIRVQFAIEQVSFECPSATKDRNTPADEPMKNFAVAKCGENAHEIHERLVLVDTRD